MAEDAIVLALKALNGGLFVVGFALVAEGLSRGRDEALAGVNPSLAASVVTGSFHNPWPTGSTSFSRSSG